MRAASWSVGHAHDKVDDSRIQVTLANVNVQKIETCKGPTTMTAIVTQTKTLDAYSIYINRTPTAEPGAWTVGPDQVSEGLLHLDFLDKDCVPYIGGGNGGYFTYDYRSEARQGCAKTSSLLTLRVMTSTARTLALVTFGA